jgi:hypothetical protein
MTAALAVGIVLDVHADATRIAGAVWFSGAFLAAMLEDRLDIF